MGCEDQFGEKRVVWFKVRLGQRGNTIMNRERYAGHLAVRRKSWRCCVADIKVPEEASSVIHDHERERGHRGEDRECEDDKENV